MKKFIGIICVVILAVLGYLYSSPYLALNSMKTAFEEQDMEKFNSYINYPSVRQGLKEQIKTLITQEMNKAENAENNEFGELGSMMAVGIMDKMVDSMVTPEAVNKAVEQGKLSMDTLGSMGKKDSQDKPTENEQQAESQLDYSAHYVSVSRFAVDMFEPQEPNKKITLIMDRDGLNWQVTRIEMPLDELK